jgi:hypothetical protein
MGYTTAPTVTIQPPTGMPFIPLTGISSGPGAPQILNVTATSSNPALIPTPSVTYSSPSGTGLLTYTALPNHSGTAVITVTAAASTSSRSSSR